ncbi:MAG: hypothetical protein UX74_C0015G0015 [Parcubacteria group bacterium GW2011_GWA2_47_10b]|nr:MAG: hypothetical protein UX74_C0015G0015 [Parcubacteria group bacterium GW2011_GWA2_47_10b]
MAVQCRTVREIYVPRFLYGAPVVRQKAPVAHSYFRIDRSILEPSQHGIFAFFRKERFAANELGKRIQKGLHIFTTQCQAVGGKVGSVKNRSGEIVKIRDLFY